MGNFIPMTSCRLSKNIELKILSSIPCLTWFMLLLSLYMLGDNIIAQEGPTLGISPLSTIARAHC